MTSSAAEIAKQTIQEFNDDECAMMAASLSYYTVFSLPPLLLILVRGAGALFGSDRVEREVVQQTAGLIGTEGA